MVFDWLFIGGLLLILGAFFSWRGYIQYSIITYAVADVFWLLNALESGNTWGSVTIAIGFTLGVLTYIKMHVGVFHKNLKVDKDVKNKN